ncbi:TetR/AcrR family transcriptional regulator [Rhodococcus rhodnii]|uniref:TetR/AcrR family transcriptional regulator n=1 Tax=Rhodococcus rhodnii TaxID=38312 RepID=A0A6P2CDL2_9NOCA|nr:TetR/AcrR family transcriptional regulator [Rhodococcus rhodnii]
MMQQRAHTFPVPDSQEPGLRERKKLRTRREIATAAFDAAAELGFDAATVELVAERAGVSTRTFFNYFESKEDAVVAVVTDAFDRFRDALDALDPSGDPVADVRSALVDFVRTEHADMAVRQSVFRRLVDENPPLHRGLAAAFGRIGSESAATLARHYPERPGAQREVSVALAVGFALLRLVVMGQNADPADPVRALLDNYDVLATFPVTHS